MELLRNCVVVTLFMIVSTNALNREDHSTEIDRTTDHQLDRHMAQEAFVKLSPYPRDSCTEIYGATNDFNANEIMDMVLEYLRDIIKNKNMDRVDVPKFEESFTKKVAFVKVKGTFKGEDGWLEKTTSIARKGNATVRLDGTSVLLDSTLGLNELRLGMVYTARFSIIGVKGHLEAEVESNAVSFSGGLEYSRGNCRIFLKSLKLKDLGKIVIHVTGLGKLNWIYSKIVTWITSRLHEKFQDTIENKIREILEKELDKVKCPAPFTTL